MLAVSFAAFADEPPVSPEDGDPGTGDPVPINGKLIWLAIVGIAFAYYQIKKYNALKQKA